MMQDVVEGMVRRRALVGRVKYVDLYQMSLPWVMESASGPGADLRDMPAVLDGVMETVLFYLDVC
jgi:hypothetical protein